MNTLQPITSAEFGQRLDDGELGLCVVGMSNVGKTRWSELLEGAGFDNVCCDEIIEAEVADELLSLGYSGGINDMAKWLGQPYDEQFARNQKRYMEIELEKMKAIVGELQNGPPKKNTIIDTTGSVAHTHPAIRQALSKLTTVVYLEATADMRDTMFKRYMADPKPVIWEGIFSPEPSETNEEALTRCYPNLLEHRSSRYAEMAHVTVPHNVSFPMLEIKDTAGFLRHIKDALPRG